MREDMTGWTGALMCSIHTREYTGCDGQKYKHQYKVDFSADGLDIHKCFHFDPCEVQILREEYDEEVAA